MRISVENIGKKFVREWIIRKASFELLAGQSYTLVGPNGSGKSTLIQLLTGMVPVSEGAIQYFDKANRSIHIDKWYKQLVMAAPYLELIEEFTLRELFEFHVNFKPMKDNLSAAGFEDFIELSHARNKIIRHFSSGMKQRVKLGLAFMSDVPVVFLDEPTSNLDVQGIDWYLRHVQGLSAHQILILGSNVLQEYEFCKNIISVGEFK